MNRIAQVLQHTEHSAQLIEYLFHQTARTILHLSRGVLSGRAVELREPSELLEKDITAHLSEGN
jgi:hypothetical protein